jgi:transposase-like protein
MDIREQAIQEYLQVGVGYRTLAKKYGVSRTTINKWVMIHQGIHNLPPTQKQQKHYLSKINNNSDNVAAGEANKQKELEEKIALLEKQLEWEKLRVEVLDTLINVAEKHLNISIRKKPGALMYFINQKVAW